MLELLRFLIIGDSLGVETKLFYYTVQYVDSHFASQESIGINNISFLQCCHHAVTSLVKVKCLLGHMFTVVISYGSYYEKNETIFMQQY
jgi:hypothetical protein